MSLNCSNNLTLFKNSTCNNTSGHTDIHLWIWVVIGLGVSCCIVATGVTVQVLYHRRQRRKRLSKLQTADSVGSSIAAISEASAATSAGEDGSGDVACSTASPASFGDDSCGCCCGDSGIGNIEEDQDGDWFLHSLEAAVFSQALRGSVAPSPIISTSSTRINASEIADHTC